MRVATLFVIGCAMGTLSAARASAALVSFQEGVSPSPAYASGGVTIRSDASNINTNQNALSQILVGNNLTGGLTNGRLRGLFEFNLSEIETLAAGNPYTIDRVQLVLRTAAGGTNNTGSGVAFNLSLLGNNLDFTETSVTWNNAPGGAGGVLGTLVSSVTFDPLVADTVRVFDTSPNFQAAVTNALANDPANTIRLIATVASGEGSTTIQNFARFHSDETMPVGNRPKLLVEFTVLPEPSLAGVLALSGFGLRRRRRG